jgi:hypothetical protein
LKKLQVKKENKNDKPEAMIITNKSPILNQLNKLKKRKTKSEVRIETANTASYPSFP